MKDGIHPKKEKKKCCGTCTWFNGDSEDEFEQFCDEIENYVDGNWCCNKYKAAN